MKKYTPNQGPQGTPAGTTEKSKFTGPSKENGKGKNMPGHGVEKQTPKHLNQPDKKS